MTSKTTAGGSDTSSPTARRPDRGGEVGRVARFVVIGGTSVAIDLAVYTLLDGTLDPTPAKAVSYVAGMLVGFVGNKFWSFGSRRKTASEPLTYGLLYAVTLAVNVLVNGWVLEGTGHRLFAFLTATGLTTVLNYLGLRWVTFREGVRQREEHTDVVHRTPGQHGRAA